MASHGKASIQSFSQRVNRYLINVSTYSLFSWVRLKKDTDFEELSTASSTSPSGVDTETSQLIYANVRGLFDHITSDQFIDDQIRACRPQPESSPYTESLPMLLHPTLSGWPPKQPAEHSTHPQENLQLRQTSLLPGHADFSQPSNIGAPAFPWDLDLTATTGNGSYDADFQNSQPNTSDFTDSTCLCLCHHHPQESCFCLSDCSFYKAPSDALLG